MLMITEKNVAMMIACAATAEAASKFFSPALLATMAVTPMDMPQATEYKMVRDASVNITVDVAAVPTWFTKINIYHGE